MVGGSKVKSKSKESSKPSEQPEMALEAVSDSDMDGFSDSDDGQGSDPNAEEAQVQIKSGGHIIKKLDDSKKRSAKSDKGSKNSDLSGIIYISRLPKGFHEHELSKYFSQFGDLKQVRLARNKKTGNTRHYGFVEFVNKEDSVVAQESMNNYLLMGHLIKVVALPKGKKIEKLFKYKKRVYKESPLKDAARAKDRAMTKHEDRIKKLQEAGMDFKW